MLFVRWRDLSRSARFQLVISTATMISAVIVLFSDKGLPLMMACLAVMIPACVWQLIKMQLLSRRHRRYLTAFHEAKERAFREGRPFSLNDLPPEQHENIQVSWARHRLKEK